MHYRPFDKFLEGFSISFQIFYVSRNINVLYYSIIGKFFEDLGKKSIVDANEIKEKDDILGDNNNEVVNSDSNNRKN